MAREVELTALDLRYEGHRMKNPPQERKLLAEIQERGIEEPLEGVDAADAHILLNGFKRYRCARRLRMGTAPYTALGQDEALGIIGLLRVSNSKALSIIEQARFIEDLKHLHGMSVAEIAETLSRSKAWVSMRLGLMKQMGEVVRRKIFSGAFPVYPYMYCLRQFMRMNGVRKAEIETFVSAVSGKKLSVREIEQLAHCYFRGPESLREEIRKGNVALPLERMRGVPQDAEGCSEFERMTLKDLELTGRYMQRVMGRSRDRRLKSRAFYAQANLLAGGILSRERPFIETMRQLYDRSAKA